MTSTSSQPSSTVTAMPALDENLVRAARVWVSRKRPYYGHALFRCPIVATDAVPTLAIDQAWRIYMNPSFVNELEVTRLAAALIHEINHNLRSHNDRARNKRISPQQQMVWNIAGDLEANDDLRSDGLDVDLENWMFPEKFGLEAGRTAEEYFDDLMAMGQDQGDGQGQGQGQGQGDEGDGHGHFHGHDDPQCGGGARGYRQSHEQDGESEGGLSEAEGELMKRRIAKEAADYERANGRGSIPAGLSRFVEQLLRPQVDWRRELAGAVRKALAVTTGADDYSYSRLGRRDDVSLPVVMPGMVRPVPNIAVVVDTSGSMSGADLQHALGEIQGILRQIGMGAAQVKVMAVDAAVHTAQKVFDARQVALVGGGGTNMVVGIEEAAKGRPSAIVVLTDGETPWPAARPVGARRVVAGIISPNPAAVLPGVPEWIRTVTIDPQKV